MYKVTFSPDRNEIEVTEGTTLLEAAEKAGIFLNSLCGGEGVCGKCRIQVINGKAKVDKNSTAAIGSSHKSSLNVDSTSVFILSISTSEKTRFMVKDAKKKNINPIFVKLIFSIFFLLFYFYQLKKKDS